MRKGDNFANEIEASDFIICSAKSNFNINELDDKIFTKAKELFDKGLLCNSLEESVRFTISEKSSSDKKYKSCNC